MESLYILSLFVLYYILLCVTCQSHVPWKECVGVCSKDTKYVVAKANRNIISQLLKHSDVISPQYKLYLNYLFHYQKTLSFLSIPTFFLVHILSA